MKPGIQRNFIIRKNFAKIKTKLSIPNLIDIQQKSYLNFLQNNIPPSKRENIGLQSVFNSIFPIKDYNENISIEFIKYNLEDPKFEHFECKSRGATYSSVIKLTIRLVVWDKEKKENIPSVKDVKEQEIYFGEIPLMTEFGTFIVNGTERVVVSQLHRSPGVFFDSDKGKNNSNKILYKLFLE